ncbi:MAG: hypothetical protein ABIN94_01290 [Ferruginibacter sp.]
MSQTIIVDKKKFFKDEGLLTMKIVADFKKLMNDKLKKEEQVKYRPATITCNFPDGTTVTETVEVKARGQFRRSECYLPPVMINFKTATSVSFKKLGHLKLVWPCAVNPANEQLVLKEYLIYKMYNLLTKKSFRVRLVKIAYQDIDNRIKSRNQYAFFIEDVEEMAKRHDCVEVKEQSFHTELTDRHQTTIVALFEYMIGNTDWAVPIYRNIKLIRSETDSTAKPFVVPYDFDYSGLVDASYAIPIPELNLSSVRERKYTGFSRTPRELQATLEIFRKQRPLIDSMITNCEPLLSYNKTYMLKYINDFFNATDNEKNVNSIFIENARKE